MRKVTIVCAIILMSLWALNLNYLFSIEYMFPNINIVNRMIGLRMVEMFAYILLIIFVIKE